MLIIPKPKTFQLLEGTFSLKGINHFFIKGFTDDEINGLLWALNDNLSIRIVLVASEPDANFVFIKDSLADEAYQITVKDDIIKVLAKTAAGLFYSIKTLKQIINDFVIPNCYILDEPDLKIRGIMLDISRSKVPSVKTIKSLIDFMSDLKYNHLQLYIEGFSFEYLSFPEVLKNGNFLKLNEYLDIEKYAKMHYIDLVPNQNGFGHMSDWLARDEYKHLAECPEGFYIWGSKRIPSTLDPTNPLSFELVKKLYDDMLPHSSSKWFNMNFDEPYELGYGKSKAECDALGKEQVFINYFESLAEVVRSYHKRPMLWGDVLIKHPEAIKKLPKDVIFIDWGYSLDYPFHSHLKTLKEANMTFMAAAGTSTWSVITSRYDDMLGSIRNASYYTKEYGGEGILVTDWGDVGHLQYLPFSLPGFIFGALSSWNVRENHEYLINDYLKRYYESEEIALLIIDMSNYTRHEGEYRSYGSKLFSPIIWAEHAKQNEQPLNFFLSRMKSNLLTKAGYLALKLEFKSFEARLKQIVVTDTTRIVKAELANALSLLKTLLSVNQYLNEHLNNLELKTKSNKIIKELNHFLRVHKQLWDERNNPAGYVESSRRIKQLIHLLENL